MFKSRTSIIFTVVLLILLLTVLLLSKVAAPAINCKDKPSINVFAASGTITAMMGLVEEFEKRHNIKVNLNFASSSTLARQIASGAPADVFVSANQSWIDHLIENGKVSADATQSLLSTQLVLVGSDKNSSDMDLLSLVRSDNKIAIGSPDHVPAGIYAKQALISLGLWDKLEENIVTCSNVAEAHRFVQTSQADFAIVYKSLAVNSKDINIISEIPNGSHEQIVFPIALCSRHNKNSKMFYDFLLSPMATNFFTSNGFEIADDIDIQRACHASQEIIKADEWSILKLSAKVSVFSVAIIFLPGVFLGWLFARKDFPFKSIVESFFLLPLVMPPVVTGFMALKIFGESGLGSIFKKYFNLSLSFDWKGAVVVSAMMSMPLLIRAVKVSIEMIDERLEKAASTLGSSPLTVLFRITLPLALPGIFAGVILAFARSIGEFGATTTFAGNLANKTQTISLAIHNYMQIPGNDSAVYRLVLISAIFSISALAGSEIFTRKLRAGHVKA